ncbi:MAG: LUD domain-containing protein [Planctomycetota bacterium]|nr:LUD domain-containing protein [Planctomycetota bacterium]
MKGTARGVFFERIRDALNRSQQNVREPLVVDHDLIRRGKNAVPEDPAARSSLFKERAIAVGMEVSRCDKNTLNQSILKRLSRAGISSVLLPDDPLLDNDSARLIQDAGIAIHDNGIDIDQLYTDVECGVTVATVAVASTGSVVVASSDRERRLASLVPPNHLVLLPESRIVPDLIDLSRSGGGPTAPLGGTEALPSCLTVVTGPSKTADIEGVLITGVHGPGRVDILLLEGC